MYANHVPVINGAMRYDLETFKRGVMFAILSIRQPFPTVPVQCKELKRLGAAAPCLWGSKRDAHAYLEANAETLWRDATAAQTATDCILVLTRIPGLGIIKAAFVAQMLGHDVACLDSRNVTREGLAPRAWRSDGERCKRAPSFQNKVAAYVRHTAGRACELWDAWCEDAAQAHLLGTGDHVSQMHLDTIVPKRLRHLSAPVAQAVPC